MTERELYNKLVALGKELELIMRYEAEFVQVLGKTGMDAEINKRLEQYRYFSLELKRLQHERDKS